MLNKSALIVGLLMAAGCVSTSATLSPEVSGNYVLEPTHAFLTAKVTHFGISDYSIDLNKLDAQLVFNADAPEASRVSFQVDLSGIETNFPNDPDKKTDWEEQLKSSRFLNAEDEPVAQFVSSSVTVTGENVGTVAGVLTFRGEAAPIEFDVSFNGSAMSPLDLGKRRVGFNATGTFNRTDFGLNAFTSFVSDEVRLEFSGEFIESGEASPTELSGTPS